MNRILILLASLLVVGNVYALPPCPSSRPFDNCYGVYTYGNGDKYVGEWRDDLFHGQGTISTAVGEKYVGDWRDGRQSGEGTYTWPDGNKYTGGFKDGLRHGRGSHIFPSGGRYDGEFKGGRLHGHGVFAFPSGEKYAGELKGGQRWSGIEFNTQGEVTATFSNGTPCDGCTPTPVQLALAQEAESIAHAIRSYRKLIGTGTGFLVNENFIATADHVLRMNDRGDVCNSVSIMYRHDEYQTTIADLDPANDIGLLKLSKPISSTAKIRNDPDLRLGETAINYGFPLTGELSSSAKITSGAVNSLAGYNNNSAFIQYDAASQFGNSGGPVLDASGNVIGVVSAKLDDAENQLVNFATKSTILEAFLKANKVPFEKADLGEKLELPDIAEKAETFTVLVGCWE